MLVFPAHAGVILSSAPVLTFFAGFPRTRGGDPSTENCIITRNLFSPHTRG